MQTATSNENEVIIQQLPTGALQVMVHEQDYSLDSLMGFAARANAKRGFLFLSKVLGKHWPVRPARMQEIHETLASQIDADLPEPIVFIAMAETAVGLGQGVFEAFQRKHPHKSLLFIHTTRYHIDGYQLIEFEEAHSHAPRQFIHMPKEAKSQDKLLQAQAMVIIDDEASTGNTFLNLKNAVSKLNPHLKRLHLSTITNFMGKERNDNLTQRFAMPVTIGAALSGEYKFEQGEYTVPEASAQSFASSVDRGASPAFGRVGTDRTFQIKKNFIEEILPDLPEQSKILVLGTGEFMHPAFVLGRLLENQGHDVFVQSTTRSPILQWGSVSSIAKFPDNYGEGIANFVYNVVDRQYDVILLCHETPVNEALLEISRSINAQLLHFTSENTVEKISLR